MKCKVLQQNKVMKDFSAMFLPTECAPRMDLDNIASWIRRSISGTLMDVAILCLLSC
jgi:hypothetical protein